MIVNPLIQNLGINDLSDSIVTISDNKYKFKIILFNTDGNMVKINYSSITELKIVDKLPSFYCEGHIIFNNDLNAMESFNSLGTNLDGSVSNNFNTYSFRGDGRDFLMVDIQPFLDINEPPSNNSPIALTYLFSVYDYEELIYDNNLKQKKLYFHDYVYFLLREKNSYFSTGRYSRGIGNEERSMYTGDAIKKLLESVLNDYGIKLQTNDWDKGGSKIFYSSPAQYKAIDDLYYLIDNHVSDASKQNCPAMLMRRKDIWSLVPVVDFYKNAFIKGSNIGGPALTEQFIIGRSTAGDNIPGNRPLRTPPTLFSLDLPDYTVIDNFQFIDPSPTDVMNNMTTHVVHNYDVNKKMFSVDIEQNNLQKNLQIFKQSIVNLQKGGVGNLPSSNIPSNQTYMLQKNVVNKFNPNRDSLSRLNSGRNKFLLSSIFLNAAISFKCRGNVVRTSGNFFTVSRGDNYPDNKFDNKVLGIYMTTVVEHVFGSGTYSNNIFGVKTYNFDKSFNTDKSL
jgi:hypothetical protein